MLNSISIQNIALITGITINLDKGLNVITGETGAGKSLVIDSISLLLGDKADRTLISYDKDYAYVEAVFSTNSKKVLSIMEDLGLEPENTIVVSRKLYKEGKNECRVNGKVFTLGMLKRLTAPLMDLHGQFEHQSILDNKNQLAVIDGLGGTKLQNLKEEFTDKYNQYLQVNKDLSNFTEDDEERNRLIDLYNYQIDEITNAAFKEGEEEELKEYRLKVLNQQKILSALENSVNLAEYGLNGGGGLADVISRLLSMVGSIKQYGTEFDELYNRLDSLKIDALDIVDSLICQKDNLDFNEQQAKINEERLDLLSSLKKKYGKDIPSINNYLNKITSEVNRLVNAEDYIIKLKAKKQQLISLLTETGEKLTSARKEVAKILQSKIEQELKSLAFKNTTFVVDFAQKDITDADETGLDQVEYMFSANAGQPAKPLNKIISGGEMSRFMLAVKNITANIEDIDTMIFDEIDTGVSGDASQELAKKLLTIGINRQVICVSHLAQVASFADHHYFINKTTTNNKTSTNIKMLDEAERVTEIARLIGGAVSNHSLEHAKFMMQNKTEFLKTLK